MATAQRQTKTGIWINAERFKEHVQGWTARDVGSLLLFITKHRHPDILPEMFPEFISTSAEQEARR
jgi:hypothetical protein